ncbi:MAG: DUF3857 domain-containing protein [Chitinophagales bacterium]|nr:DUF3857 domain-containing protein [Chitinophagales bacterium]
MLKNARSIRLVCAYIFLMLFPLFSIAQIEAEWGKIPPDDLKMEVYPLDSNAHAAILHESGWLRVKSNLSNSFYTYHLYKRIKIFDEAGFNEGDVLIPYYHKNGRDQINNLKARITLPNGQFYNLAPSDFNRKNIYGWINAISFSFPNVEKGAILEYSYVLQSENIWSPQTWYFQHPIPTKKSIFKFENKSYFTYVNLFQPGTGLHKWTNLDGSVEFTHGDTKMYADKDYFVIENVPALPEESYITTMDDYRARIRFQADEVKLPDGKTHNLLTSWDEAAKKLIEADVFGSFYRKKKRLKAAYSELKPLLKTTQSETDKAQIIYYYLSQKIEWNRHYSPFPEKNPKEAFDERVGTDGEIGMILLSLLNEVDIEAYPVLTSTRDHGRMQTKYPIISQFNHLLVLAILDGKLHLLDTPQPNLPFGQLMTSSLNYTGWLIKEDVDEWIIIPPSKSEETTYIEVSLNDQGNAEGQLKHRSTNYAAHHERILATTYPEGNHWQEKMEANCIITNLEYTNLNNLSKPLQASLNFEIPKAATIINDYIYFSPYIIKPYTENPFKLEQRYYPVDFPHPFSEKTIVKVTIPEGYILDAFPEHFQIQLPDNKASFSFEAFQSENVLNINQTLNINTTIFEPVLYKELKELFSKLIEKEGEQLVFKKTQ